ADYHLLRATVDPGPRIVDRPDAAADLHAQIAPGEAADRGRLDRTSAARAFQVDHVQPRPARDAEGVEHGLRVAVALRRGEIAAREAHALAAEQIERCDHV